ncbi:fumarylacetoacetase [Maribacter hydrothermalis]|uniref:fumarylacetoacetase n=1 Tax=Maribacter hydrothermalis TaxID=1836467 RepID=A0A1B7YXQ7_9FLAO|nr:fumarylacetoacetase [Maribacter hydrothermalis]APQ16804.1 fumarylacetoacetase [Maribacter hydrothermalis]OBR35233.1 fumarylacetoacetase [Maribacter hydrothermalis]
MTTLNTWVSVPEYSDFSIYNLPFGIFSVNTEAPKGGIAIGEQIVDLSAVSDLGLLDMDATFFNRSTLNEFIALGKKITNKVRLDIQKLLVIENSPLKNHPEVFILQKDAKMHLPVQVGDYTDFYSSIEHATNVGKMFRDPENALLPNWRHIPVGYHGRASSIVVSGTDIHRPMGQVKTNDMKVPVFKASGNLDFELEMGFVVGKSTELGERVSTKDAAEHIFGLVLFNDWSARDIQKWEYVPLGPFLGKSFASSMSPWIVTLEALEPFKVQGPEQQPEVLSYLKYEGENNYDIQLEVGMSSSTSEETTVSKSNFKYMYWNMMQQLAHHTVNGCNLNVGDVMASGTISGKDESSYGSLLEISWGGKKPFELKDGSKRTFIEDNDTVTMRGFAEKEGKRVGFGEVSGTIIPSK